MKIAIKQLIMFCKQLKRREIENVTETTVARILKRKEKNKKKKKKGKKLLGK